MAVCEAAGLIDVAREAGPQVGPFLLCVVSMVIIAIVGGTGHIVLTVCDYNKPLKLVDKGTYISLLSLLVTMGLMVIGNIFDALMKFVRLIFG